MQVLTILGCAVLALAMAAPVAAKDKVPGEVDLAPWVGEWAASEEQNITITLDDDGALLVEGAATWGASDPERVASGGINVGDFSVLLEPYWFENEWVTFKVGEDGPEDVGGADEYDCVIEMRLSEDAEALEVTDNYNCGGHNVTFEGTYSRADG